MPVWGSKPDQNEVLQTYRYKLYAALILFVGGSQLAGLAYAEAEMFRQAHGLEIEAPREMTDDEMKPINQKFKSLLGFMEQTPKRPPDRGHKPHSDTD